MTINSMINAPVFKIQGTIAYRNASAFKASGDLVEPTLNPDQDRAGKIRASEALSKDRSERL